MVVLKGSQSIWTYSSYGEIFLSFCVITKVFWPLNPVALLRALPPLQVQTLPLEGPSCILYRPACRHSPPRFSRPWRSCFHHLNCEEQVVMQSWPKDAYRTHRFINIFYLYNLFKHIPIYIYIRNIKVYIYIDLCTYVCRNALVFENFPQLMPLAKFNWGS